MKKNKNLKNYSTFQVKASCKEIFFPKSWKELLQIVENLQKKNKKYKIIGNASNILFYKKCKKYYIISTRKIRHSIRFYNDCLVVSASCSIYQVFSACTEKNFSGFEKLALIPGTIGGAIFGNAGCDGVEIFDHLISVKVYNNKKIYWIDKKELYHSYRDSFFKHSKNFIILSAKFKLSHLDRNAIFSSFEKSRIQRFEKQPSGKCAGSIFKNLHDLPAGKLIECCGLKGKSCGQASISLKHANFIVNDGDAKSKDIIKLIKLCKHKVKKKFNKSLQEEIEIF